MSFHGPLSLKSKKLNSLLNSCFTQVDQCGITVFGTSAKWIAVQEDRGIKPRQSNKLTTLRTICSTGSPLKPHSYDYVYRDIKPNVLLASITGIIRNPQLLIKFSSSYLTYFTSSHVFNFLQYSPSQIQSRVKSKCIMCLTLKFASL